MYLRTLYVFAEDGPAPGAFLSAAPRWEGFLVPIASSGEPRRNGGTVCVVQIGESAAGVGRKADPYTDTDVIDERAPRFNQGVVALTCWVAIATGAWWLAALMGLQLAVGLTFGRRYCLQCVLYFQVVQPLIGEGEIEDARPPRFANILGAAFLIGGGLAHVVGQPGIGRALNALVATLATLAVVTGFCLGCSFYRLVARLRGVGSRGHERVDLDDFHRPQNSQLIVQFTHPLCTDCRKLQRELEDTGRDIEIVDVTRRRDLARKYGVNVVPLAFAVGPDGRVLERLT
jgi:hypothetical protein